MSLREKQPIPADQSIRFPVSVEVLAGALQEGIRQKQVEPRFIPPQAQSRDCSTYRHPKPDEWVNDSTHLPPTPSVGSSFEQAFKFYEPAFHTVFYRKYHPDILQDAKQVALLALFIKWRKDKSLLELRHLQLAQERTKAGGTRNSARCGQSWVGWRATQNVESRSLDRQD